MPTPNLPSSLHDLNWPRNVEIKTAASLSDMLSEVGRHSMLGFSGNSFFGTAFVQGNRLQFTTAMPVSQMVDIAHLDRSGKGAGAREVTEHSNRPKDEPHARDIRRYLLDTAGAGEKFIMPNFIFNLGVGLDEDGKSITLMLFDTGLDGAVAWPALLLLPTGVTVDVTDGGHRGGELTDLVRRKGKVTDEQHRGILSNAVDVKIVFEADRISSHQDFADCGKAKPISKSMVSTFDIRDKRNEQSKALVIAQPFLEAQVDATAANVNLTAKSKKIWSMSSVRSFVGHAANTLGDLNPGLKPADIEVMVGRGEATRGAIEFFTAVIEGIPVLKAIREGTIKPADAREAKGGNVLLRGAGMAILARAFTTVRDGEVELKDMATALGTIDWNVLTISRDSLPPPTDDDTFEQAVRDHCNPLWTPMIAIGHRRFKLTSSSIDVDLAWERIRTAHPLLARPPQQEAA